MQCSFIPLTLSRLVTVLLLCISVSSAQAASLAKELVVSGLTQPLFLTHAPGDESRVFVVEQPGRIRVIDISGAEPRLLEQPFLDLSAIANAGNPFYSEQGLLGLTFHPRYQENGQFYVNYTSFDGVGDTVIAEYLVSADPNRADPQSGEILLQIPQPEENHNGGWMDFGPDGYLYISTGDGGGANDRHGSIGNGQNLNNLLGKMLRIDVDSMRAIPGSYGIPADNPFGSEIWSYGLRNPWRPSFDRLTGDLYIADVGQNAWEELNFQPADSAGGENYGWRCLEGYEYTGLPNSECNGVVLSDPFLAYGREDGCSVTGGYVYRGSAIPSLQGHYLYADFCTAEVWSLVYDGTSVSQQMSRSSELAEGSEEQIGWISSFGEDARGELYICDYQNGSIFKIVPAGCQVLGDTNQDCTVDVSDLAILLSNWGPCEADCPADLNQDGLVDVSDLAILLSNWGDPN